MVYICEIYNIFNVCAAFYPKFTTQLRVRFGDDWNYAHTARYDLVVNLSTAYDVPTAVSSHISAQADIVCPVYHSDEDPIDGQEVWEFKANKGASLTFVQVC